MPATVAALEGVILSRCSTLLVDVGMDGTTQDGTNSSLRDPIGFGLRQAGGTVATFGAVTDADVQTVDPADLDMVADLAEYRALQNAYGRSLGKVDLAVSGALNVSQHLSDRAKNLERALRDRAAYVRAAYGLGAATLSAGVNSLDFVQQGDDPFPVGVDGTAEF